MAVRTGDAQRAVACASEVPSIIMRGKFFQAEMDAQVRALEDRPELAFEKDFLRWMLSDGAGAALIEAQPAPSGLSLRIDWVFQRSYANEMDACMIAGAEKLPDGSLRAWHQFELWEWADRSVFNIKQDVKQLNEHIVEYALTRALKELVPLRGLQAGDIDWFLPHYSSTYFRERAFEGLKAAGFELPYERWFTNLTRKGNTGSASIYIILEELLHSGRLKDGQRLLCWVPESGRFSTAFMHLTVCAKP
jgi:3-oxoacyl-[acyl-carrier-protein] synthase-3